MTDFEHFAALLVGAGISFVIVFTITHYRSKKGEAGSFRNWIWPTAFAGLAKLLLDLFWYEKDVQHATTWPAVLWVGALAIHLGSRGYRKSNQAAGANGSREDLSD